MKIDVTSLCFGFKIQKDNDSGTPAWATSIGQAPKNICYIDTNREGLDELVYGMMYKSHSDFENLKVKDIPGIDKTEEPKGDRERMMFSVFDDVYVNGKRVNGKYTLSYEREDSESHKNRLHICYAKYLTYKNHSNKETLNEMARILGCNDKACWFVYDISIKNQDELHFSAIVVDKDKSKVYSTSKQRGEEWNELLQNIYKQPEVYSIDELAAILKTSYNNGAKSDDSIACLYYFGLNYAEHIINSKYSTKEIVQKAGLKESLYQELNKSLKLYQLLKRQGWFTIKINTNKSKTIFPLQQIYYGAPGTGKSNAIKEYTSVDKGIFTKDFTFRTTFHPDSDYSTFVGAYKPIWNDEKEKIVYEFRPQAFLKAYVAAWTHPNDAVALVIEEINRGNCAQIFGDIFQLLDRDDSGLSKYPIETDVDVQKLLSDSFKKIEGEIDNQPVVIQTDLDDIISEADKDVINVYYVEHYDNAFKKIKSGQILTLPQNLSILATMNTSDQSLFPMDSAFKRRWDWIYQPIVNAKKGWKIDINGYNPIDWWNFLERINKVISDLTTSEDKQLGYFFCMPDKKVDNADKEPTLISTERFVEKVVFYLWNDVFKDYSYDPDCCNKKDSTDKVLYADFYNKNSNTINIDVLVHFINQLKAIDKNDKSVLATKPNQTPPASGQNAGVNNKDDVGGEDNNEVDEEKAVNNETGQQLQLPIDNKQSE